jgi:hypothetical protein
LVEPTGGATFAGELVPGAVGVADAANDRWALEVNGNEVARETAYGWANSYTVTDPGAASLSFDTPVTRTLAVVGQAVLWALAILLLLRWKTSGRWRRRVRVAAPVSAPTDEALLRSAELETTGAPT